MARTTRDGILAALKRRGEARAEDLAAALGVTVSAMRQHLVGLTAEGLVGHKEVRSGPGRPKHFYFLTPAAESLFPKTYDDLTNELLDYVADESPELLEKVFERRRDRRIRNATQRIDSAGSALIDRVAELARILDEDGYLAEVVEWEDGAVRVVEHNCAILGVAARYGQACATELDFIRTVLPDADIERVSHMMAGQRQCAYEIKPKSRARRASRRAPA